MSPVTTAEDLKPGTVLLWKRGDHRGTRTVVRKVKATTVELQLTRDSVVGGSGSDKRTRYDMPLAYVLASTDIERPNGRKPTPMRREPKLDFYTGSGAVLHESTVTEERAVMRESTAAQERVRPPFDAECFRTMWLIGTESIDEVMAYAGTSSFAEFVHLLRDLGLPALRPHPATSPPQRKGTPVNFASKPELIVELESHGVTPEQLDEALRTIGPTRVAGLVNTSISRLSGARDYWEIPQQYVGYKATGMRADFVFGDYDLSQLPPSRMNGGRPEGEGSRRNGRVQTRQTTPQPAPRPRAAQGLDLQMMGEEIKKNRAARLARAEMLRAELREIENEIAVWDEMLGVIRRGDPTGGVEPSMPAAASFATS